MENGEWGYEFDMKEIEPGKWQSSYWLIGPAGEVTPRTIMPVRTSQDQSLDEAQAAGKEQASRRNSRSGAPSGPDA